MGRKVQEAGSVSSRRHLVAVVEQQPLLLLRPEAEAGVKVVPQGGNVAQSQVQVALTREVGFTGHLHTHTSKLLHICPLCYKFSETRVLFSSVDCCHTRILSRKKVTDSFNV